MAVLFAVLGTLYRLDSYPPYFDYDSSTEAIFVNNLSFQDSYDFFFAAPPRDTYPWQNRYRALYAAQRLPVSLPLSWIQRATGHAPHELPRLLKFLSALLGVLTAFLIARCVLTSWIARGLLVGTLCVHPALLLVMRTGVFYWILVFALFWIAILEIRAYCRSGRSRHLYGTALVFAYMAMSPYPSYLPLPAILLSVLLIERRLRETLRDRHFYLAVGLSLALFAGGTYAVATHYDGGLDSYMGKLEHFRELRGRAVSIDEHLLATSPVEKLTKLVNQHLLFKTDDLGDRTRDDTAWTLGAIHVPFLFLMLLAFWGLVTGVRRRDPDALIFASTLACVYAFFMTFSFPEGRFILVALPCWAYFSTRAITDFVSSRTYSREWATAAIGAMLLVLSTQTYRLVATPYNDTMASRWNYMEGIHEVAEVLPPARPGVRQVISLPIPRQYKSWLYYAMATNFGPSWLDPQPFAAELERQETLTRTGEAEPTEFYMLVHSKPKLLAEQERRGFKRIRELESQPRGWQLTLFEKRVGSLTGPRP